MKDVTYAVMWINDSYRLKLNIFNTKEEAKRYRRYLLKEYKEYIKSPICNDVRVKPKIVKFNDSILYW